VARSLPALHGPLPAASGGRSAAARAAKFF
jgi:hypothetical protein